MQFIHESDEQYNAARSTHLTSHSLADYRKCPLTYHQKQIGLIKEKDSAAFSFGRAAHCLILEGQNKLESSFAVGGPINPATGRCYGTDTKKFTEWLQTQGKPAISTEEKELIECLDRSVKAHYKAGELLQNGTAEGIIRGEYNGLLAQSRLDYFNELGISDLKTCDDLDYFESDIIKYGYCYQMAFYASMIAIQTGTYYASYLIGVEKKQPYRCGVWLMDNKALYKCSQENQAAIESLKNSKLTNTWFTNFEETRVFSFKKKEDR